MIADEGNEQPILALDVIEQPFLSVWIGKLEIGGSGADFAGRSCRANHFLRPFRSISEA
jgi:hypothetical protein